MRSINLLLLASLVLGCTPPPKESPDAKPRDSGSTGMGSAGGMGASGATSARASGYAALAALILSPAASGSRGSRSGPSKADLGPDEISVPVPRDECRLKRATITVDDPAPDGSRKIRFESEREDESGFTSIEVREAVMQDGHDGYRHFRWLGPPVISPSKH
ncbi:MAG TPA: hypothetical protein VFF73_32340 [Planctomycetota bacterium]|nr:hypothetical protein [Planctomycetota bacterium]